ncbi:MAG: CHAT domain-containing protein, partial [Synechococcales cyanobacterium RM1_1_8]|nr:CHAT domain-containing protein [Synechococcales cyanobacterium RM1_1_8]
TWLIKPIENDLAQAKGDSTGSQTLLYAPDGALRYIPLAALHDGDQWLAERLQINNITAASIDDLNNAPASGDINILAAAFSEGQHQVDVGDRTLSFPGLAFAGREVENLAKLNPKTETRFNDNFNADIVYEMNDYNIVHLATHATFASGTPEDSFILFGDGSRANLNALKRWNIPKVDLIVLSACETAVGDELGSGEEILGFGYLMQQAGADAAIASLWQVSDGGTQSLMDAFYAALRQGPHQKPRPLQLAQQALIRNDYSVVGLDRAGIEVVGGNSRQALVSSGQLNHPYYWAPG